MPFDAFHTPFKNYLLFERAMSSNTIEAYERDLLKFESFLTEHYPDTTFDAIQLAHCQSFVAWLHELGIHPSTQARTLSGIKAFFRYLVLEEVITADPTHLLAAPKISRKIPEVLSVEEIDLLFSSIDHTTKEGPRNRAILETLYACGLRVSELIELRISQLFLDIGFIRVIGKGNKERLIPINESAGQHIRYYLQHHRALSPATGSKYEDTVFLNRRGKGLSRVMIYTIIKRLAEKAQLKKSISPHTFRHTFATHLYEGGADLRAIQEMLGHESITTTEIYAHADQSYLKEVMASFHPRWNAEESNL